jgi:multiple sugar transport system substrate-binding protein
VLKAAGGAAAGVAGAAGLSAPAAKAAAAQDGCSRLTVWGVVSFTEEGDALLADQMRQWGEANGVEVEYVALPGSDYATRLATAVEAGTVPDIAMMIADATLFYADQERLVDVTDVYDSIKDLAGGMWPTLLSHVSADGVVYAIPMETDVTVMYARLDLMEEATGERTPPATLEEMEQAAAELVSPPTLYPIGLTLGLAPDAHGQIASLIINNGGTLVDESGAPALDSPATVATLEQIKRWWDEGLIPPNSPSWDDAGNNQAYQSGQVAFAFNPASIFAYLEENDPDLLADTTQAAIPAGSAGNFPAVNTWAWAIFESSPCVDQAKALITELMQPEPLQAVYEEVGGRWYPVYRDLSEAPFWAERPFFDQFPGIIEEARELWYPAEPTPILLTQLSAITQKLILPDMVQQVLLNGVAPAEAAAAGQRAMEQAFEEAAGSA